MKKKEKCCGDCQFYAEYENPHYLCNNDESECYGEIMQVYESCEQFKKMED